MYNTQNLKPFKKGHDPRRNLKGRPKVEGSITREMMKLLKQKIETSQGKMTRMELLCNILLDKAVKGNTKAVKIILDRIDGKVRRIPKNNAVIAHEKLSDEEKDRVIKLFSNGPGPRPDTGPLV